MHSVRIERSLIRPEKDYCELTQYTKELRSEVEREVSDRKESCTNGMKQRHAANIRDAVRLSTQDSNNSPSLLQLPE